MRHTKRYILLVVSTLLLASCDQPKPQISTFTSTTTSANTDVEDMDEEVPATAIQSKRTDNAAQANSGDRVEEETNDPLEYPKRLNADDEIFLKKSQFAVSYNTTTLCPNYVCWHLKYKRTRGNLRRPDDFTPDESVPYRMQVNTHDYSSSGYDRGHMCPAGDNKNSLDAMLESFMMTNICPQSHDLNAGDWNELEELCREWSRNYGDLYICCGPIFDSAKPRTIGKRKHGLYISVPDRFFKVILFNGRKPRAIGFIFPNRGTRNDLREYATTVDKVERITGLDFFHSLPDEIEQKVESQCNPPAWNL